MSIVGIEGGRTRKKKKRGKNMSLVCVYEYHPDCRKPDCGCRCHK